MKSPRIDRHARHIMLKEIGGHGQKLLANAKVVIIGVGGLGSPCALYLAAAGLGQLTLIDDDVVDLSNLQRQIIYRTQDIDKPKTEIAKKSLLELDPELEIIAIQSKIDETNARDLLKNADLVIDGCDNFTTRHLVNKICHELKIPLLSGALGRFDGQIAAFDYKADSPCYQCFVPEAPTEAETCAQMGVIGAVAGVIGTMMALEAIKIITHAGDSLFGKIMIYNGLNANSRILKLSKDKKCAICGTLS